MEKLPNSLLFSGLVGWERTSSHSMLGGCQRPGKLLSSHCPQEPPEDDANIIEKILASRMVQKEVSDRGASGAEGPCAEEV